MGVKPVVEPALTVLRAVMFVRAENVFATINVNLRRRRLAVRASTMDAKPIVELELTALTAPFVQVGHVLPVIPK